MLSVAPARQSPQCAFDMSMESRENFAITISSRISPRSSSTHEPSDPPSRVVNFLYHFSQIGFNHSKFCLTLPDGRSRQSIRLVILRRRDDQLLKEAAPAKSLGSLEQRRTNQETDNVASVVHGSLPSFIETSESRHDEHWNGAAHPVQGLITQSLFYPSLPHRLFLTAGREGGRRRRQQQQQSAAALSHHQPPPPPPTATPATQHGAFICYNRSYVGDNRAVSDSVAWARSIESIHRGPSLSQF